MPCNVPVDVSVELEGCTLALRAVPQAGSGVLLPIKVGGEVLSAPGPVQR